MLAVVGCLERCGSHPANRRVQPANAENSYTPDRNNGPIFVTFCFYFVLEYGTIFALFLPEAMREAIQATITRNNK